MLHNNSHTAFVKKTRNVQSTYSVTAVPVSYMPLLSDVLSVTKPYIGSNVELIADAELGKGHEFF